MTEFRDEDVERLRRMIGGKAGLVDGAVPALLFVAGNAIWSLTIGAAIAAVYALGALVYRAARKQPVRHAAIGLAGLLLSLAIALITRNPSTYFVPGTAWGGIAGLLFVLTAVLRQPVSAMWAMALERKPKAYYALPEVRRLHILVTLAWGSAFIARAAFRAVLIANDETELLAATHVILGYPVTAALAGGTVVALRWAARRYGQDLPEDVAALPDETESSAETPLADEQPG